MKPFFLLMLLLLVPACLVAEEAMPILGTFEAVTRESGSGDERVVQVTIEQKDGKLFLTGGAGYSSGRSTAPEFSGEAAVPKAWPCRFSFEDSFENKGVVLVSPAKAGVEIEITVTEVAEPRCLAHYGKRTLKRIDPKADGE